MARPDGWAIECRRSLSVRATVAGIPSTWAILIVASWAIVFVVAKTLLAALIGGALTWALAAAFARHDPDALEKLRRSLMLRGHLRG